MGKIALREVVEGDLDAFFEQQLDPDARRMAAFVGENPGDRDAFEGRWARILADDSIVKRTIVRDAIVVGHVVRFDRLGDAEVSYWIAREHWGQGIATGALRLFLEEIAERPLLARAAADNLGSRRVLEKCGFVLIERGRFFAHGRGEEIDEVILRLE